MLGVLRLSHSRRLTNALERNGSGLVEADGAIVGGRQMHAEAHWHKILAEQLAWNCFLVFAHWLWSQPLWQMGARPSPSLD